VIYMTNEYYDNTLGKSPGGGGPFSRRQPATNFSMEEQDFLNDMSME